MKNKLISSLETIDKCWHQIERSNRPPFIVLTRCFTCWMVNSMVVVRAPVPSPTVCPHCHNVTAPVIGVSSTAN